MRYFNLNIRNSLMLVSLYYYFFFIILFYSLKISIFIALTADMNNILSYITFTIIFLIVFNFPVFSLKKINNIFGFDILNPEYVEPIFETISQLDDRKFKDMERLGMKLKDNESILTKFRAMKKSIAKVQIIITTICNFMEKMKNLLFWKDPQRTTYFLILMFILYVFFSRLPIRVFIILGGIIFFKYLKII